MVPHGFEAVLRRMLGPRVEGAALPLFDPEPWMDSSEPAAAVGAAFLVALCGPSHPLFEKARWVLEEPPRGVPVALAQLYRDGLALIGDEVTHVAAVDDGFATSLDAVADRLARTEPSGLGLDTVATAEALWSVFFPEGIRIVGHEEPRESELRDARTVTVSEPNPDPIVDPSRQILFTSNVLLTVPSTGRPIEDLPYPAELRTDLALTSGEAQAHWYDHPIQIGVEPAANELLYGLRGLDDAVGFERRRSPPTGRVTCVLSVSVTHGGLRRLARRYVEEELARSGGLPNLDVIVFTEDSTDRLIDEVLAPAARHYLDVADGEEAAALLRGVFGVDGAYGRHYSFLKAVSALWHVLIDPAVKGTFKIDLDQVFPQEVLVAETGASAFEHLATPLWGACGIDAAGRAVELGMVAGALVNERDIGRGLFTPDADYPARAPTADEHVFFSALTRTLSTRAEMMERYDSAGCDGIRTCLERVHVTGGTNGTLVDSLRRHRPFTPGFIGRAEDQAYILSTLGRPGPRLTYAHAAGLIMRHDKEAFAGEAIAAAQVGNIVGDDIRILYFSAYADVIAGSTIRSPSQVSLDRTSLKSLLDPFTGCFISRIPVTVVLLRFALRSALAFAAGRTQLARDVAENGAQRVSDAIAFTADRDAFRYVIARERLAWDQYYDSLEALEAAIGAGDSDALGLRERAREIVAAASVRSVAGQRRDELSEP